MFDLQNTHFALQIINILTVFMECVIFWSIIHWNKNSIFSMLLAIFVLFYSLACILSSGYFSRAIIFSKESSFFSVSSCIYSFCQFLQCVYSLQDTYQFMTFFSYNHANYLCSSCQIYLYCLLFSRNVDFSDLFSNNHHSYLYFHGQWHL